MADAKKVEAKSGKPVQSGLSGLQKAVLWGTGVLLLTSVIARIVLASSGDGEVATNMRAAAQSGEDVLAQPKGSFEALLPYVTEGSLFALIGFALGYTTRKIFKIALILIAVAFVGVQIGVYMGWMSVDWNGVVEALNEMVLNLKEDETVTKFVTNRVPSVGALLAGTLVGFRRG